jgi:hypothetical protein
MTTFLRSRATAWAPWLSETEERTSRVYVGGLEALYNIDYDKAYHDFKEIVQLYPNHPGVINFSPPGSGLKPTNRAGCSRRSITNVLHKRRG